ncbi:unnamed protein product [Ilex paraguariensis]|uniref:Protease Do-like PDZ domain-containing protein n=1 Tax=Ilex paraguariensis TaxID=185542 RepID=A0ABC8SVT7_9AQUA
MDFGSSPVLPSLSSSSDVLLPTVLPSTLLLHVYSRHPRPLTEVSRPSSLLPSNPGTSVPFRHGERIGFSYLVSQKYTGDNATVKVLRGSKVIEFDIKLATHKRLIPAHNKGRPPSYYIVGGFVFTAVSVPYLRSEYGKDYEFDAPVKILDKHLHAMAQSIDEQLVVISQVLAFNGKPVKNLKSLVSMVEACDKEYLKFDLEYQQIAVLKTESTKAATLGILSTHCIPSAISDDLKT